MVVSLRSSGWAELPAAIQDRRAATRDSPHRELLDAAERRRCGAPSGRSLRWGAKRDSVRPPGLDPFQSAVDERLDDCRRHIVVAPDLEASA
jgi:hypothetical protein